MNDSGHDSGAGASGGYERPLTSPGESKEVPQTCDFAIVTIIDEASQSVCARLGLDAEILRAGSIYWWGRVPARDGVGTHVVVCGQVLHQSTIPATGFTRGMLQAWEPRFVLVADIGGGVEDREELALGDVVIGDALRHYEYLKATEDGDEPRSFGVDPSSMLLTSIARAIGRRPGGSWRAGLNAISSEATIRRGEIAVGDKLFGNPNDPRLAELLERYPKVLAFDMESTAVAYAVREAKSVGINSDLLILRGISDFVNSPNNQKVRDEWRKPACEAAAAAAHAVISSTPVASHPQGREDPAPPDAPALAARRRLFLGAWLLLLAAAGPLGYQFAHGPPSWKSIARSHLVELSFAKPWREVRASNRSIAGLRMRSPVALEYRDETVLLAGLVANARPGGDPAPAALRARWRDPAPPRSIAGADGLLYRASIRGGGDRLTMLATTAGWVAIACEGARETALASCEQIAAGARLQGVKPRPAQPSAATAEALNAMLERVGVARTAARSELSSNSGARRADAASGLARVLSEAAIRIARLSSGPRDGEGLRAARGALDAGAGALLDLAAAAVPPRAAAYASAARRVERSEADLAAALERAGYPVEAFAPLPGS